MEPGESSDDAETRDVSRLTRLPWAAFLAIFPREKTGVKSECMAVMKCCNHFFFRKCSPLESATCLARFSVVYQPFQACRGLVYRQVDLDLLNIFLMRLPASSRTEAAATDPATWQSLIIIWEWLIDILSEPCSNKLAAELWTFSGLNATWKTGNSGCSDRNGIDSKFVAFDHA